MQRGIYTEMHGTIRGLTIFLAVESAVLRRRSSCHPDP
jgi:hypothetical protein